MRLQGCQLKLALIFSSILVSSFMNVAMPLRFNSSVLSFLFLLTEVVPSHVLLFILLGVF
jgi:hypothetical protein